MAKKRKRRATKKKKTTTKKKIKLRLLERSMSQVELSNLIKENPQSVNRAIKGWTNPKSVAIRKKIYRVLNI